MAATTTTHTLRLLMAPQRRSLTRILMLVEGRGMDVTDVRAWVTAGTEVELSVSGSDTHLPHVVNRLRQLPHVLSVEIG